LKQFLALTIILFSLAILVSGNNSHPYYTQAVIRIPQLNSSEIQQRIEKSFCDLSGVQSCEASVLTQTLTLIYDDRKINRSDIDRLLNRWGCQPEEYLFNKLLIPQK